MEQAVAADPAVPPAPADAAYRCRQCNRTLFPSRLIVAHACSQELILAPDVLRTMKRVDGRLACAHCSSKLGRILSGSCQTYVALQLMSLILA